MTSPKYKIFFRQFWAWLGLEPLPRRAKRAPIRKSVALLVASSVGFVALMVVSAVALTPRLAVFDPTNVETSIEPMPSVESAVVETSSSPIPHTPKRTATAKPKKKPAQTETIKPTRKHVSPPKVIGVRYACAPLNVRTEPGLEAKILKQVPVRTKIHIMNRVDKDWRMVRFDKKNRWMYGPCLWKSPPAKLKPAPKVEKPKSSSTPSRPSKPSTSPKPQPKSSAPRVSTGVWDRLAKCESGGNWSETSGTFEGGLQFLNSTWLAQGGGKYARHAYDATREEQIAIAKKLQAAAGWGQWPVCSSKIGLR